MRIVFVFLLIVAIISGFSQNSEVTVYSSPTGVERNGCETLYNLKTVNQSILFYDANSVLFFLKGDVSDYLPAGVDFLTLSQSSTNTQSLVDISNIQPSNHLVVENVSSNPYEIKQIILTGGQQNTAERNTIEFIIN